MEKRLARRLAHTWELRHRGFLMQKAVSAAWCGDAGILTSDDAYHGRMCAFPEISPALQPALCGTPGSGSGRERVEC